jgi:hypothetical protein
MGRLEPRSKVEADTLCKPSTLRGYNHGLGLIFTRKYPEMRAMTVKTMRRFSISIEIDQNCYLKES